MGARGPTPKPAALRRRRNATNNSLVIMQGAVEMPPPPRGLRKLARDWYESLGQSAQADYYEPSDWACAQVAALALNSFLVRDWQPSPGLLKVWFDMAERLGTTEEARRRMHIEVSRQYEEPEPASTALDEYRRALDGPESFEEARRRRIMETD